MDVLFLEYLTSRKSNGQIKSYGLGKRVDALRMVFKIFQLF